MFTKSRSMFGRFIDKNGYTQKEISDISKLGKNTVTRLCSDQHYRPRGDTLKKIIILLNRIDKSYKIDDFFDI